MSREAPAETKAAFTVIELQGYRVGLGEHDGTWIATAQRDADGQFHSAKAPDEHRAICELAVSVGVELGDGQEIAQLPTGLATAT